MALRGQPRTNRSITPRQTKRIECGTVTVTGQSGTDTGTGTGTEATEVDSEDGVDRETLAAVAGVAGVGLLALRQSDSL